MRLKLKTINQTRRLREGGGWVEVAGEQRWINEGQGKKAEERGANKKRREEEEEEEGRRQVEYEYLHR